MNTQSTKKIVFILGSISQPRCIKRIQSFLNAGYGVEVYGFDRNIYRQNAAIEGVNFHILNEQKDGSNYLLKTIQFHKGIQSIIKKENKNECIFYSFGFAITLFMLLNRVLYIYEISDILYGYKKYVGFQWLFKIIDKILIKKSLLTVMTSEGFLNYLYKNERTHDIIIQPNRLTANFLKISRPSIKQINSNKLVFSYVGAIRYPNTVFRFAKIIGKSYPNFQFHFYGESYLSGQAKKISDEYENVFYHGAFKNPEDLEKIYQNIDILVACYDTEGLNERIAEPNKLYESLYFKKPIIVSKGIFLEKQVMKYKSGFSIDATSDKNIYNFLNELRIEKLKEIQNNISSVNLEDIIDDNSQRIISYLNNRDYL